MIIRNWYDPYDFKEWLKRAFSLVNIALFVLTATFVVSEFRFDWCEHAIGTFLASTNDARPQTGAIWEAGKQTSNAHAYLNEVVNRKENARQDTAQADSFSALAERLLPGQWVTLEKDRFKALYLSLEKNAALSVMEPAQLVWLLNGRQLERIFCEGTRNGIKVYFIDSQNRVIHQLTLDHEKIQKIEAGEEAAEGKLSDIEAFQDRVYSAGQFFNAVFRLPRDILPDLIQDPDILLRQDGRMTRVGIWNEAKNGYIVLGFEFEQDGRTKIVYLKGREWAVWQLSLNLRGESQ